MRASKLIDFLILSSPRLPRFGRDSAPVRGALWTPRGRRRRERASARLDGGPPGTFLGRGGGAGRDALSQHLPSALGDRCGVDAGLQLLVLSGAVTDESIGEPQAVDRLGGKAHLIAGLEDARPEASHHLMILDGEDRRPRLDEPAD